MPRSTHTLTVAVVSDSNLADTISLVSQALEATPSLDVLSVVERKPGAPKFKEKEKNGGRGKEAAKP